MSPVGVPLWVALLAACTREEWRNADLQLEVPSPLPAQADQVRLCVDGVRHRTVGAGGERYALPGLPASQDALVTVDVLVAPADAESADTGSAEALCVARAGPVTLGAARPWAEAELAVFTEGGDDESCPACPEPCTSLAAGENAEEDTWLLAVRFAS